MASINVFALCAPVVFPIPISINNCWNICSNTFIVLNLISCYVYGSYKRGKKKERKKEAFLSLYFDAYWL